MSDERRAACPERSEGTSDEGRGPREVARWGVGEAALESARDYENPFQDVAVRVEVTGPSGGRRDVDAFWDGGRAWRARFRPDEPGEWRWRSSCSEAADAGLHGREGAWRCVPYEGDNPLGRHGPPRLSADRRSFAHADGTPLFWLADTAWNGVIRSREPDWRRYLQTRREQGFTVIQFVATQWRGCTRDPLGETAYAGTERITLNPGFFQRLDPKVAAIGAAGLVAAPVMLWSIGEQDPGQALAEADAVRLARYLAARWGAYPVAWMLAGDGEYRGERAERWRRIGRAVFGDRHDNPVTMHPGGQRWVGDEFRREPWFDFIGYQSGHGSSPEHLRWLVAGPPATDWRNDPPRPVVNLEPNYEAHPSYHIARHFTDHEVRRAAYWSLLVAPPAGVTYGHNAIWTWPEQPEVPEGHPKLGTVEPWHAGLNTPGVRSMTVLRRFFESLPRPWAQLRPAPDLLAEQPGDRDPEHFVAAALTEGGDLAVAYLPVGGAVRVRSEALPRPATARWFDPRTGAWTAAGMAGGPEGPHHFTAPGDDDWVLCVGEGVGG